jgi:hypothetical protein
VDSSGNVGIGTSSPSTTLDVNGAATISGDLSFGDNNKAIFGAGSDLQIYHDGTNSFIRDTGTGDLFIDVSNNHYLRFTNGEYAITTTENGHVDLRYDNAIKLTTTATGIDVTGTVVADNVSDGTLSIPTTYVTNGSAKAWVNFNGTGTIAARDSLNLSSLTDNGTGDYTVNFTNAFATANYVMSGTSGRAGVATGNGRTVTPYTTAPAAGAMRFAVKADDSTNADDDLVYVIFHGDLA